MQYTEYQSKTISRIIDSFKGEDGINRILDADEVGLGKTYVAKGVIRALAYEEAKNYFYFHRDKECFDYRVLYLCPNLNIANQNKEKLELEIPQIPAASQGASGNKEEADKEEADTEEASSEGNSVPPEKKTDAVENRLTMLYLQILRSAKKSWDMDALREEYKKAVGLDDNSTEENKGKKASVTVYAITPATSVKIKRGGNEREREYIYRACVKMGIIDSDASDITNYYGKEFEHYNDTDFNELRYQLKKAIKSRDSVFVIDVDNNIKLSDDACNQIKIIKKPDDRNKQEWEEVWEKLRSEFAVATLECFNYNLVILDEFQNFREILRDSNIIRSKNKKKRQHEYFAYAVISKLLEDGVLTVEQVDLSKKFGKAYEVEFGKNKENVDAVKNITDYIKNKSNNTAGEIKTKDSKEEWEKWEKYIKNQCIEYALDHNNASNQNTEGKTDDAYDPYEAAWNLAVKPLKDLKWYLQKLLRDLFNHRSNLGINGKNFEEKIDKSSIIKSPYKDDDYYKKWMNNKPVAVSEYYTGWLEELGEVLKQKSGRGMYEKLYSWISEICSYEDNGTDIDKDEARTWFIYRLICLFEYYCNNNTVSKWCSEFYKYMYILADNRTLLVDSVKCKPAKKSFLPLIIYESYNDLSSDNISIDTEKEIVKKVFEEEGEKRTNILLLSATPFRISMDYDTDSNDENEVEELSGDGDIVTICKFLDYKYNDDLLKKLEEYKKKLLEYSKADISDDDVFSKLKESKRAFEEIMVKYFSRMERYAVLRELKKLNEIDSEGKKLNKGVLAGDRADDNISKDDKDEIQEGELQEGELPCGNINDLLRYIVEANNVLYGSDNGMSINSQIVRYALTVPYMFTFMHKEKNDSYKLKELFSNKIDKNPEIYKNYDNIKSIISRNDVKSYDKSLGLWHDVFRKTLEKILMLDTCDGRSQEAVGNSGAFDDDPGAGVLLWIPSSVPIGADSLDISDEGIESNNDENPFVKYKDYGKVMVFSRWTMVPRALAFLYTYEVKRRLYCAVRKRCEDDISNEVIASTCEEFRKPLRNSFIKYSYEANCGRGSLEDEEQELFNYIKECFKKAYHNAANINSDNEGQSDNALNDYDLNDVACRFINNIFLDDESGMLAVWAVEGYSDNKDENIEKIINYCKKGRLQTVLEEWFYLLSDDGEHIEKIKPSELSIIFYQSIKTTRLKITLLDEDGTIESGTRNDTSDRGDGVNIETRYARCLGMSKDDDQVNALGNLQRAFNTPFVPFVFATTSMGQEGLDFHAYADRIIHWNLPSSPVDFEQREGRINRRNCLAIRKALMSDGGYYDNDGNSAVDNTVREVFDRAFENARKYIEKICEKGNNNGKSVNTELIKSGVIPNWVLPLTNGEIARIERIVPYYNMSRMLMNYHENNSLLQLYRSVIGQANPDEILNGLMKKRNNQNGGWKDGWELCNELSLDFSPYNS